MTEQKAIELLRFAFPQEITKPITEEVISMAVAALEKQISKKPIEKNMPYNEEVGFNSEWLCPCCNSYIGYFTEGMTEPEQMEYCNVCGQRIARDWSEE